MLDPLLPPSCRQDDLGLHLHAEDPGGDKVVPEGKRCFRNKLLRVQKLVQQCNQLSRVELYVAGDFFTCVALTEIQPPFGSSNSAADLSTRY